jgi:hypothetical protein
VTTSLAPTDESIASFKRVAQKLLGVSEVALEGIDGGRNSRVYRLIAPGAVYAFKTYFRHASDSRSRMETEFQALRFLWDNGESAVPEPIAASAENDCAIYEWIDGEKVSDPSDEQIDAATDFLSRLHRLRHRPGADLLRQASEACFSASALVDCLTGRLAPLQARTDHEGLAIFLRDELCPLMERICAQSRETLGSQFSQDLTMEYRTLSPSDFGFHNALLRSGGGLVFLDLEYFGWDDPVKMIADFLLHPGMAVSATRKCRFAKTMLLEFPEAVDRFEAFRPLFALKWCMILLNEFLPEHLLRRKFAGMSERDRETRQTEQLAKARKMLRLAADVSPLTYGDQDRTN